MVADLKRKEERRRQAESAVERYLRVDDKFTVVDARQGNGEDLGVHHAGPDRDQKPSICSQRSESGP